MNAPLQLSIPESAQVHIHCGPLPGFAGPTVAPAGAGPEQPRRHKLRLAAAAALLFGGGYFAHGFTAPPVVASLPALAATDLPLPPAGAQQWPPALPAPRAPAGRYFDPGPPPLLRPPLASAAPTAPSRQAPTPGAAVAPRSPFGLD